MRHLVVVAAAVLLAAVASVAVSSLDPTDARAAGGGGNVKKCGGGRIHLNAAEKEAFARHNKIRRDRNIRTLCVHPALQRAARDHSDDMMRRDYFSHNTKGRNESACERLRRFGYRWSRCAENIAWGSGSLGRPENIMKSWMKSNGHRHHILDGRLREIGIGTAKGTFKGRAGATMYTADFGTR